MTEDLIQYPQLIDHAMRGVVREVLRRVLATGLPGEHHFYISFSTTHPGVKISEQLKSRYPREITIVLQHQFWDFRVEESYFTVTLSFSGVPEKLTVPYAALTAFADPSIKFGLQFQQGESAGGDTPDEPEQLEIPADALEPAVDDGSAEIISLDAFRKK